MTIGTEVTISAAHFVHTTDTPCKRLHGHNWRIEIEIAGQIQDDGMVIDFTDIKNIINEKLDHKLLIPVQSLHIKPANTYLQLCHIVDSQGTVYCLVPRDWIAEVDVPVVTAEHLAEYIKRLIHGYNDTLIVYVKVWESEKSYAKS